MNEQTYQPVEDENSPKKRQEYWEVAFGLQAVDGLKPSRYMVDLADQHIIGKKSYQEVKTEITDYYKHNSPQSAPNSAPSRNPDQEADEVSTAIYQILNDKAFRFDILTLKNYHRLLFQNLDPRIYNPGNFRSYNITKREAILGGKSVAYQSSDLLEETLQYDFNEEKSQDYLKLNQAEKIVRLAEFTSRIWQVHPFQEGNTRTVAVFMEKYLGSLGMTVDNEPFEQHSLYFRNALVRANYSDLTQNVQADPKYLIKFFEFLLLSKNEPLDNKELYI